MSTPYFPQRVIVYVDGFNFYYGLKREPRWKRYYWIDIVKLFEMFLRPEQELVAVKYFSARSIGEGKSTRQNAFFQANKQNLKFHLILGKYLKKTFTCRNCKSVINTYEEKESDVQLAAHVVADAYKNNCDVAIVVSADSDMIPAVNIAMEAGVRVFVYFPPNQHSADLSDFGNGSPVYMGKYESRFKKAVMPDKITLRDGFVLKKPTEWITK